MVTPRLSVLQICAFICGLVGLVVSFIALSTPAWQVVYAREIMQWVQSGLWMNCQTRPSGMYTCAYTFSDSDFDFYTNAELVNLRTPPFYAWQRNLLAVFLVAQALAFVGLASVLFAFHPPIKKISAVVFVVAMGLSAVLHVCSSVAFALLSQMVFHVSVSGIYEKHRGYSFYLELLAAAILILSLLFAVTHLVRMQTVDRKTSDRTFTQPSYAQQQAFFQDNSHSLIDPYEHQFAMRDLPPAPRR
uniref:Clc-like protein 2 n=1 Tax=Ditylenchus dipsaci TaxID=166011 RepID=A0A915DZJ3_9BILA